MFNKLLNLHLILDFISFLLVFYLFMFLTIDKLKEIYTNSLKIFLEKITFYFGYLILIYNSYSKTT